METEAEMEPETVKWERCGPIIWKANFTKKDMAEVIHPSAQVIGSIRGLDQSEIFQVLDADVDSKSELKKTLMFTYPERQNMISQVFSRY